MRLRRRGTTGKTVGCSVFKSSIKSRMSPWKYPIRAPWMRMTPWWKHSCLFFHMQISILARRWHCCGDFTTHSLLVKNCCCIFHIQKQLAVPLCYLVIRTLSNKWIKADKEWHEHACYSFITPQTDSHFLWSCMGYYIICGYLYQ